MKAKIKSANVEMVLQGTCIEELISRFILFASKTEQGLGSKIEIIIKTKTSIWLEI